MAQSFTKWQYQMAWALLLYIEEDSFGIPESWFDLVIRGSSRRETIMFTIKQIINARYMTFRHLQHVMRTSRTDWADDVEHRHKAHWRREARRRFREWVQAHAGIVE